jgi:hypothetical protein
MAYAPTALALAGGDPTTSAPCVWTYKSTDAMTTIRGAGYISDAKYRGMKVGDTVFATTVNGSNVVQTHYVTVVMSFTAGAADLADGTAITVTNT